MQRDQPVASGFQDGELAPRIRELTRQKEELQLVKAEVEESLRRETVSIADDQVVRDYADDLRDLLVKSSITEQQGFPHSFVEKIEVNESEVRMYYTIPMPPDSSKEETVGVLPIIHYGSRRGG